MKLIISSLIPISFASFAEMDQLFQSILKNKTISNRAFGENQFALSLEPVQNYGCWCYSLKEHTNKGKSKPQDELDALCKKLAEGYECARIDAENEGLECSAWEEEYVGADGRRQQCSELKTEEDVAGIPPEFLANLGISVVSKCKKQACLIEQNFVEEVADLFLDEFQSPIDPRQESLKHENFDIEATCISKDCVGSFCSNDKQCCGEVPNRRTYKPVSESGEDRKCCGNVVYLNAMHQCCESDGDLEVVPIGTCLV